MSETFPGTTGQAATQFVIPQVSFFKTYDQ